MAHRPLWSVIRAARLPALWWRQRTAQGAHLTPVPGPAQQVLGGQAGFGSARLVVFQALAAVGTKHEQADTVVRGGLHDGRWSRRGRSGGPSPVRARLGDGRVRRRAGAGRRWISQVRGRAAAGLEVLGAVRVLNPRCWAVARTNEMWVGHVSTTATSRPSASTRARRSAAAGTCP